VCACYILRALRYPIQAKASGYYVKGAVPAVVAGCCRLRKRVAEPEEVNEILKKEAVIFAKAPLGHEVSVYEK
jgi:hypothetical protein